MVMITLEELGWDRDATSCQGLEQCTDHFIRPGLVLFLQFALILGCEGLLIQVERNVSFLLPHELEYQEWIPGLTLAQGRIQPDDKEDMRVIRLGEQEEFDDTFVGDLVVRCLSTKAQKCWEHVNVVTTTWGQAQCIREENDALAWCCIADISFVLDQIVEDLCRDDHEYFG